MTKSTVILYIEALLIKLAKLFTLHITVNMTNLILCTLYITNVYIIYTYGISITVNMTDLNIYMYHGIYN